LLNANVVESKINDLSLELSAKYADMYSIIGWHPEDSIYYHEEQEKLLIEQLQSPKVVGLGEIGLDYQPNNCPSCGSKAGL